MLMSLMPFINLRGLVGFRGRLVFQRVCAFFCFCLGLDETFLKNIFVWFRTMYKILYKMVLVRVVLGWVEGLCCKGIGCLAGGCWV